MENIISLHNIVVEFDGEKILKNIDLDIRDKEFVTLLQDHHAAHHRRVPDADIRRRHA